MKDLRDEVRAAFEKEQAAHPPTAGMRRSIVDGTVARPHRQARLQWIAVAAALVITALVIVSLVSSRLAMHTTVPSHRSPSGDYGPPPAGISLFYLEDPDHSGWYTGFDWSGKPRATIKLAEPLGVNGQLTQSPDGTAFAVASLGKGHYDEFLDRLGTPMPSDSEVAYLRQIWADDSAHLCTLDYANGGWRIGLRAPGAAPNWARLADFSPPNLNGILALELAGCSARNDTAVLDWVYTSTRSEIWVVRISDGKTLKHETHPADELGSVVASPDCTLLALTSSKSAGYIAGPTAATTNVTRLSDGATLMKVDPSIGVLAFSADNRTMLASTTPWVAGAPTHLAVLDVQSGQVLWRYDGNETFAGFFVNPSGSGFAVMLESSITTGAHPVVDVIVIAGDGQSRLVHGTYLRP